MNQQSFKEVYLQKVSETNNLVWAEKKFMNKISDKEWSEVFNLTNDVVLIW